MKAPTIRRRLPLAACRYAIVGVALLLATNAVLAHDGAERPGHVHDGPEDPSRDPSHGDVRVPASAWSIGVSAAGVLTGASGPWPTARIGALLQDGAVHRDRRGDPVLEAVSVDAGLRLSPQWRAEFEASRHGDDPAHVERAAVAGRVEQAAQRWRIVAGRVVVPMGAVVDRSGHFDAFSRLALAKEAAVGHGWLEQGAGLDWQSRHRPLVVGIGLWRGDRFPGSPNDRVAPSLRIDLGDARSGASLFVAQASPQGRGSPQVRNGSFGHTHSVPDCAVSQQNLVCLDGRSRVFAASVYWRSPADAWALSGAALARHETGVLYSSDATGDYRGLAHGGWVEASWRPGGGREIAARLERLVLAHTIAGVGATRLAQQAGLAGAEPVSRIALAWHEPLARRVTIGLELGHQRGAGVDPVDWVTLRLRVAASWGG
ncbi:MAG: hypothetical protein AB7P21_09090 [Lautropia sp.]